jgi:hypothetical protein
MSPLKEVAAVLMTKSKKLFKQAWWSKQIQCQLWEQMLQNKNNSLLHSKTLQSTILRTSLSLLIKE